jgi:amino acid permease
VDGIIAAYGLAVSIIYSGILGDVFTPLLESAGMPAALSGRTSNIIILTVAVLFPICLLKDLSTLAFTSILGFGAVAYTVLFIVVRALDGTYTLDSGKFVTDGVLKQLPSFSKSSLWNLEFSSLVLASSLGLAYIAHYNGPAFYRELKNTDSSRFTLMVQIAFAILTVLYTTTMCAGYATFGDVCQGNLLLNYHPGDILSTLGRVSTGFSILFGFPLVAKGAREGVAGFAAGLGMHSVSADKNHTLLVMSILIFATFISCTVKDVSLVVGLTGAALGSTIVYIIPAIIYTRAVRLIKGMESKEYARAKLNLAFIPFGLAIGGLGVYMTIKESIAKQH